MMMHCQFGYYPLNYLKGVELFLTAKYKGDTGQSMINEKIFISVKGGVRIYYPDGVIRFFSNNWEGPMFV